MFSSFLQYFLGPLTTGDVSFQVSSPIISRNPNPFIELIAEKSLEQITIEVFKTAVTSIMQMVYTPRTEADIEAQLRRAIVQNYSGKEFNTIIDSFSDSTKTIQIRNALKLKYEIEKSKLENILNEIDQGDGHNGEIYNATIEERCHWTAMNKADKHLNALKQKAKDKSAPQIVNTSSVKFSTTAQDNQEVALIQKEEEEGPLFLQLPIEILQLIYEWIATGSEASEAARNAVQFGRVCTLMQRITQAKCIDIIYAETSVDKLKKVWRIAKDKLEKRDTCKKKLAKIKQALNEPNLLHFKAEIEAKKMRDFYQELKTPIGTDDEQFRHFSLHRIIDN